MMYTTRITKLRCTFHAPIKPNCYPEKSKLTGVLSKASMYPEEEEGREGAMMPATSKI